MARIGVMNNLLLWLQSPKPSNIHSCAIRLANRKFIVDMNLSYCLVDRRSMIIEDAIYYSFMGARLHGSYVVINFNKHNTFCEHSIYHKGVNWLDYSKHEHPYHPRIHRTLLRIDHCIVLLTPEPKTIYRYLYKYHRNVVEINISTDLITNKEIVCNAVESELRIIKTRYGQNTSARRFNVACSYKKLLKIAFE
jgi:hypothetical protein